MFMLQRYLLRQILVAFLFTCVAVTIVVLFTQSFRLLSLVIDNAASLGIFAQLALLTIPTFIGMVLPIGLAAAIVFVYQRLASDSELIVMRSAGLSAPALARPALWLGVAATLLGFALSFWIAPWANRTLVGMQYKVKSEFSVYLLRPGMFNDITGGLTFHARRRDGQGGLEGILIHDNRKPDMPVTIMAERGLVTTIEGEPRIVVFKGQRQEYDRAKNKLSTLDFERYTFDLSVLRTASDRLPDPRELSLEDLLSDTPPAVKTENPDRLTAELHQRFSTALCGLGFAMLAAAILLGGQFNRRGVTFRVIIAASCITLLQAALLWVSNLVARHIGFALLLHALTLMPFFLSFWMLGRNPMEPPRAKPAS